MTPTDPAVAAPKQLMTANEFWDFVNRPENADRFFELRRGEVIELSRPKTPHGIVTGNIARILGNYSFDVGRGYITSNDAGVILAESPGTVVGPDVAYFTDASTFDEVAPKWAEHPPVLAVEVLSPTDKMSQVNEKVEDYLRNGVRVVWVVDYETKKVTVYRPDRMHNVVKGPNEIAGGDELPGFSCRVADFFRLPGDRPAAPPSPPPSPPPA